MWAYVIQPMKLVYDIEFHLLHTKEPKTREKRELHVHLFIIRDNVMIKRSLGVKKED